MKTGRYEDAEDILYFTGLTLSIRRQFYTEEMNDYNTHCCEF